tara:strand:- start:2135 stop:2857 length:723 start_codon:yes stop_codon:yes gene_type:complete
LTIVIRRFLKESKGGEMIRAELRFKNATFMNALEDSQYNSIAELSRESGIPTYTLYSIASLRYTPVSIDVQTKLAELLDCDIYNLFEQYEDVVKEGKGYPKKLTKDIPIDSMLSISSKEVMQLESDFNTNDIDNDLSLKEDISLSLGELKDREKAVIEMHFGINNKRAKSLTEISKEFGLTRERVRQIKEKALRKLRHWTRSNRLKSYIGARPDSYESANRYATKYSNELAREYNLKTQE